MSDKKNIERLFQEKFKDFEVIPPQKIWNNIEAELHKKKKRKVIPIWFRLSGVAALLLVGALIGYGILNNSPENNPNNGVVNQESKDLQNDNGKNLIPTKNPIQSNQVVTHTENSNQENSNSSTISSEENNSQNSAIVSQENYQKATNSQSKNNYTKTQLGVEKINKTSITSHSIKKKKNLENRKESILLNNNSETISIANSEEKKAKSQNKTAFSTLNETAITHQNTLNSKENKYLNNNLDSKNKETNNAISTTKIGVEKELNKTQIAFDTKVLEEQKKDSTAVATVVPNPLEELLLQQEKEKQAVTETKVNRWQITSNVAPIYFSSASNGSPISQEFSDNSKNYEKNMSYGVGVNYALSNKWSVRGGVNKLTLGYNTNDIVYYAGLSDASAKNSNGYTSKGSKIIVEDNTAVNVLSFENVPGKTPGYLNQKMGYIEVPVELSYKLLDKKFGIELIGGMSTMFLNENNLSVISNGYSVDAGKAENLNDVSFTSNIGLGFKYKFWKSFQANVEPKFKYQLNTFSENDGGFKPYFIGIYSGLSFSF